MSRMIDISNYEAYVMDFLEGNLNEHLQAQFEAFLLKYPDVAAEIEDLASDDFKFPEPQFAAMSNPPHIHINQVDGIGEDNYEELMAWSVDEDLDPSLATSMKSFVAQNPLLEKDYKLYQATKLASSQLLQFPEKSGLKKPVPIYWQTTIVRSVAAAIILILGIVSVLNLIEQEVYTPRKGSSQFAELPSFESMTKGTLEESKTKMATHAQQQEIAPQSYTERLELAAVAKPPLLKNWSAPDIEAREMPSLAMSLPTMAPTEFMRESKNSPELNLAQFVGQELLGIDAEHSRTTKSLITESAKKVIQQSDQLALNTDNDDSRKKTVSFMAGAFEFKRVTYDLQ